MAQYSNKSILKALFLAPSISLILILLVMFFLFINHKHDVQTILTIFSISLIVYLIYCVIVVPIAYVLSIWLAHKYWLNFFSILAGSLLMWLIVSIIGYLVWLIVSIIGHLVFTGSSPPPIWKLLSDWFFYAISGFVGCCYWGLLKVFSRPSFTTHDNVDRTDY